MPFATAAAVTGRLQGVAMGAESPDLASLDPLPEHACPTLIAHRVCPLGLSRPLPHSSLAPVCSRSCFSVFAPLDLFLQWGTLGQLVACGGHVCCRVGVACGAGRGCCVVLGAGGHRANLASACLNYHRALQAPSHAAWHNSLHFRFASAERRPIFC